jgi:acetolactate synthase-1/2/3 large subunit
VLGTDFILRSVLADGTHHVFLVPGGLVDPFLPAFGRVKEIVPVIAAHEGGAAYMADGYARASGKYGVCLCIGGPGVSNTVTAVSAAHTDESPVLVISGEVPDYLEGLGMFQDASAGTFNDSLLLAPITAESYSVPDVRLLAHSFRGAVKRMLDGARNPVHLSIPRELQVGEIAVDPAPVAADLLDAEPLDSTAAGKLWELLKGGGGAIRVAILVGGGIISDNSSAALVKAAERFAIPVATTELTKGQVPEDHPLSLGLFGYAGTRHATEAMLNDLDLLIVLGATMNVRNSIYWTSRLNPKLGVLAVNLSIAKIGCHMQNVTFVGGHGGAFARWLANASEADAAPLSASTAARRQWVADIKSGPRYYDAENLQSDQVPIHPARLIGESRKTMPRDTIALVDSGAHRAFAVHYWESYGARQFLTAAALGPLGWAIAAGVGTKAARPQSPVVVFTGDGCMRMHGMEVQSAARAGLPVIYVVSNNQALGNVWLRARKTGEVPMHLTEAPDQDWAGFARALGAEGATVTKPEDISPALQRALESKKTYVIDVKTDKTAATPIEPYAESLAVWSYHE